MGSDELSFGDAVLSDEVSESIAGSVEGLRSIWCVFLVGSNVGEVKALVISYDLSIENARFGIIPGELWD